VCVCVCWCVCVWVGDCVGGCHFVCIFLHACDLVGSATQTSYFALSL
jgi:hypothetical protein